MMKIPLRLSLLLLFLTTGFSGHLLAQADFIVPAGDWRDTKGDLISATEGGIIQVKGLYYLWGMDRSQSNYTFVGVNLYSSPDLVNWTFVNQILKSTSAPDLNNGVVVERAKILYNSKTDQFVMWMHYEGHDAYNVAEVAYATSPAIDGNFTFQSHFRPLNIDSRDMNVYMDDDGKGYLICTTMGNANVSLFSLDDSFTSVTQEIFRGAASDGMSCEGHAIIKTGGYYFWIMSSCTGWDFNDNHYYYATTLAGPWKTGGNIAVTGSHTYESQVGFALPVQGSKTTTFVYMGDRWSVSNYGMSRIVMLPLAVSGTKLSMAWYDQWSLDMGTGIATAGPQNFTDGKSYKIIAKHSGKALQIDATGTSTSVTQGTYKSSTSQQWKIDNLGSSFFSITSVSSGKVIDISGASRDVGAQAIQYAWNNGSNQKWEIIDLGNGYYRLVNVNTLGKALVISGSATNEGATAVLDNFDYGDNQEWSIVATDATTSVAEAISADGQQISAYEDVPSGKLVISLANQEIKRIVVTDVQGRELLQRNGIFSGETSMPAAPFPPGIYFIRLEGDNILKVIKISIQ
jgi:sucrose-6-phosphate hydrolase SacC (GH32 family)